MPRFLPRPSSPAVSAHLVLAAALAVLTLAADGRAQSTSPEAAVREVAHELHDALARGDSAAVLDLLADGVRVYEGGHAETRSEYRAGHLAADIEFVGGMDRRTLAEHVRTSGNRVGDMALYLSEYRMTGTFRGEAVDTRGTETLVMQRVSEGGWRIVHVHWSSR